MVPRFLHFIDSSDWNLGRYNQNTMGFFNKIKSIASESFDFGNEEIIDRRDSGKTNFIGKLKSATNDALGISKSKMLEVLDSEKFRQTCINFLVTIDFDVLILNLKKFTPLYPRLDLVTMAAEKIKVVVDDYKSSEELERDQQLVDNLLNLRNDIDFETVTLVFEPIANNIPFGAIFLTGLRFMATYNQKSIE